MKVWRHDIEVERSGYWNGYDSFADWAETYEYTIICQWCGKKLIPQSGNQKYCIRGQEEDNPNNPHGASCVDDRYFDMLWQKGKHPLQLNKGDIT